MKAFIGTAVLTVLAIAARLLFILGGQDQLTRRAFEPEFEVSLGCVITEYHGAIIIWSSLRYLSSCGPQKTIRLQTIRQLGMISDQISQIDGRTAFQSARPVGHTRLDELARSPDVRLAVGTDIHYCHDA